MDKRVVVQTATPATNSFGEPVATWADTATVWASIDTVGGTESWQAGQLTGEATHRVVMRYRELTNKQRLKYGTRVFEITRVDNPGERGERLEVYCTESKA
jgi:SPP1 family predicted phage head-tail adaptor